MKASYLLRPLLDKIVSVKNTGNQPAYIRTWIALEMGEFTSIEEYKYKVIGYSFNDANGDSGSRKCIWSAETVAQIDGKNYLVRYATYEDQGTVGDTTIPSLLQVYQGKDVNNAEVAKLDGNGNGTFDILAFSQGVQSQGFGDAETALNAAFGVNHPWTADDIATPELVADADELADALNDVTYKDAADDGFVISNEGFDGEANIAINGGSYTANAGFAVYAGELTIDGAKINTAGLAIEAVGGTITVKNSEITVNPGVTVHKAPGSAVCASYGGKTISENNTITGNVQSAVYHVYNSGGTIIASDDDECS